MSKWGNRGGAPRIPHGSISGYTNHGCRCAECREAKSAYHQEVRERREREAARFAAAWIQDRVEWRDGREFVVLVPREVG